MHQLLGASAGLTAALLMPTQPATAEVPAVCHVAYERTGDSWSFDGKITITNTGPSTLYGWTLKFSLPVGQTFRSGWEADFHVNGQDITGYSRPYNSVVSRENSVQVGFHAAGSVRGPRPAEFRINDHVCTTS
ncbi:cellulose binding domain-containing protein [Krasilnikovia cinnamomea]|uniref:Cellulose binding domain-containing protein n=1 Tax=Krasilnikovia cinnamomea TaxID=349313 RepID=A0A4Q7ZR14_9ACTN|nr:cellulose binding domain-containing protein [Krasilnikovia cinnamomea]RZU53582.1 cellulose binding domain-containing protein [Krasilnikovia cinnamomea]